MFTAKKKETKSNKYVLSTPFRYVVIFSTTLVPPIDSTSTVMGSVDLRSIEKNDFHIDSSFFFPKWQITINRKYIFLILYSEAW
jgi:hypothetical protein